MIQAASDKTKESFFFIKKNVMLKSLQLKVLCSRLS